MRDSFARSIAWIVGSLPLLPDDACLAVEFTSIFRRKGWESLDREAVLAWCGRVRLAVSRYASA
jgi:hypothetical protein